MKFDCREDISQLTPEWKGERFDNGRPRVPDTTAHEGVPQDEAET